MAHLASAPGTPLQSKACAGAHRCRCRSPTGSSWGWSWCLCLAPAPPSGSGRTAAGPDGCFLYPAASSMPVPAERDRGAPGRGEPRSPVPPAAAPPSGAAPHLGCTGGWRRGSALWGGPDVWPAPRGWRQGVVGRPGWGTGAGTHRGCWGDRAAAAFPSSEWGVETCEAVSGLPEWAVQFLHKFRLNSSEECYRFHRLSSLPYTGAAIHLCTAGTGLPQLLSHTAACPRVSPSLMDFVWTFLESPLAVRLPQVRLGWVSPEGTVLAVFPTWSTVQHQFGGRLGGTVSDSFCVQMVITDSHPCL